MIVEDLKIRGVTFQALAEAIDTTTPHGSYLFNLFGTLAEYERTLITERVNADWLQRVGGGEKVEDRRR